MKYISGICLLIATNLVIACNKTPYADANRQYKNNAKRFSKTIKQAPLKDSFQTAAWVGTTNFNLRKPNFVIIHHTAQNSCEQTLKTFTTTKTQVSAHYVICKDGTLYHMLNNYLRAWHGGAAKWGNNTDINSSSIGIELDNNGIDSFTVEQIDKLINLLASLKEVYNIPSANFIGHSDIAPTRKVDPNVNFPWKKLADHGYGLWWSDTTNVVVPQDFNSLLALRIIGYDIRDSAAAISAFKRKFEQQDKSSYLNDADKKILFTLYRKYE